MDLDITIQAHFSNIQLQTNILNVPGAILLARLPIVWWSSQRWWVPALSGKETSDGSKECQLRKARR